MTFSDKKDSQQSNIRTMSGGEQESRSESKQEERFGGHW